MLVSLSLHHTCLHGVRLMFHSGMEFHFGMCVCSQRRLCYMDPIHQDCVEKPCSSVGPYRRMPQPTHTHIPEWNSIPEWSSTPRASAVHRETPFFEGVGRVQRRNSTSPFRNGILTHKNPIPEWNFATQKFIPE